jgi:hypothetical protein
MGASGGKSDTSSATMKTALGTTAAVVVEAACNRESGEGKSKEGDKKMTPAEFVKSKKRRMERASREFGTNQPKTLASTLASGGPGSTGIAKLTILQSKKDNKKTVADGAT